MTKVYAMASVSLDGYIAGPEETGFEHLFNWFGNGEVAVPTAQSGRTHQMSAASAALWDELLGSTGATVIGRRLFDLMDGWGGNPPAGTPHVVVTHSVPSGWLAKDTAVPFMFVGDGIESAITQAKAIADGKWVAVSGGAIARQCLDAGLLDEINAALVPVLLGGGTPFFGPLKHAPVVLDGPDITPADGVTHLRYRVRASCPGRCACH
jgi:dihydrofolate reductase